MSRLNRNEHLAILLENDIVDPKGFLLSLVRQMSDDEYYESLDYVQRVEDWEWRVFPNGKIVNVKEKNHDD